MENNIDLRVLHSNIPNRKSDFGLVASVSECQISYLQNRKSLFVIDIYLLTRISESPALEHMRKLLLFPIEVTQADVIHFGQWNVSASVICHFWEDALSGIKKLYKVSFFSIYKDVSIWYGIANMSHHVENTAFQNYQT